MRATSQIDDLEALGVEAEPARQQRQVEVAEERVGDDLEERVERDEHGRALPVAAGEVVPDEHHRDAAGEADDDHPGAVGGLIGEEQPGQGEHQQRAEDPVERERGTRRATFAPELAELVVPDLGEHRVHHQQEPDGDREADGADAQPVEPVVQLWDQRSEHDPADHRERDPERQEAIEPRQPAEHGLLVGGAAGWSNGALSVTRTDYPCIDVCRCVVCRKRVLPSTPLDRRRRGLESGGSTHGTCAWRL